MTQPTYEGYCRETPKVFKVRDKRLGTANIYPQPARSILSPATGYIGGYDFTLNPYRGCQYGCSYCYAAAFSPNSKMRQDWGNWVIVKENAVELLEKELQRWYQKNRNTQQKTPSIYMSSVTDPYQPIESKFQLTRQLLEVMVEYQPRLVIQTRSPAIVRDFDLFQRFQFLRVNMSIPTGSEAVRKDFEPRSPSIQARLNALSKLRNFIDPQKGYMPKISITITPLLPTFPEHELEFIKKLRVADRIVFQNFHTSTNRSLVASTRSEAIELQKKYRWWYESADQNDRAFKEKLEFALPKVEIKEGKEGFSYE
ncbi:MAG TPA: radical SAM protein [Oscillatoriales cyanobacterium M59_W2019_021]|nr:MAG: radical SAM protein [Cyanobacteria bacterium J055]HIK32174.1 radical SAM protein [Oscillatoriales cyanobacterium M4454_W2019_049]HIK51729.1 radical SAM protein [Oscillatoriales cyanobacterium M59_W2019_021]